MLRSGLRLSAAFLFTAAKCLAGGNACLSSAAVAAEIESIESHWNIDVDPAFRSRTEELCGLAAREPRDLEAQIACQRARSMGQDGLEEERERARRVHEKDPESPAATFLWARLLPDSDAAPIADFLVARHPKFPWGHFLKASIESRRANTPDHVALRQSLERFGELCPESTAAFRFAASVSDPTFVKASAAHLRSPLARQPALTSLYPTLWELEFKAASPSRHGLARTRVREDLERLDPRLHKDPDKAWILLAGHDLLADPSARAAMEDRVLAAIPGTFVAFEIEKARFGRVHPDAPPLSWFEASADWTRRWPDYPIPWSHRLWALRDLPGVPDDEAIRTGEGLLRAIRLRPFDVSSGSRPFAIRIAELWVSRGIRLREIALLIEIAVEDTDRHLRARARGSREDFHEVLDDVRSLGQPLRVEALAQLGRREEAVRIVAEMESNLASVAEPKARRAATRRSALERARAGLALADGRKDEARERYRAAIRTFEPDSRSLPEPEEAIRRARLLFPAGEPALFDRWLAEGGAAPGAVSAVAFEPRDRALPKAALVSLDGGSQPIPDPSRRTLIVVLWATWCGPCRAELPFVQALHEKLRNGAFTGVVTLNIDDNPGLVAPFVREHRYTFPVLLAKDYVAGLVERDLSIPRTWIVSSEAKVVSESSGFASGESLEGWLRRVETALSSVSVPPSPSPRPRSPAEPRTRGTPALFP